MQPHELRTARRLAGLSLAQVARAAGTSEPNVSAYERGVKTPNADTTARLGDVLAVKASSPLHQRHLTTVPALSAGIRKGVRAGWATADLLRLVRQCLAESAFLTTDREWTAYLARPSTTGDQRWDVLVAGVADMMALNSDRPVPPWTAGRTLQRPWWVGEPDALRAFAFAHSPFPLSVRGVLLDPGDLETV